MLKRLKIAILNFLHPGYSTCSKCGGNWGWKKGREHKINYPGESLFLFCEECDKVVTLEERREALRKWKLKATRQMIFWRDLTPEQREAQIDKIQNTEFIEFPGP